MRINWRTSTWGDEISLEYGKALRFYHPKKGEYRVYGSNGPIGWTQEPLTQGPGVILGRKGAYRGVEFSKNPFWVIDTAYYVSTKSDIDIRWLYYAIKFHKLGEIDDGSPIPSTTRSAVYVRKFEIPSKYEQVSIARILGSLDDKIELNRKTNEILEAMARTLFQAWFVDFEPVRAKMEGRWKRGQSLPCLPAHLYDLFPDRLVGSDERESPDGWIFGQLSSICNLNPESWTKRNRPQSIHYIDLSSTKLGRIEQISEYKIDNAPSRAQRILLKNDTILGTVRPENCSYALVHDNGLTGSTGFAVLRPKKPIYTEIVYLSATSQSNIDRLSALADGAAYPAVRPEVVLETIIPQIPDELIIEFSKTTNPLLTSIAENEKMSRTLSQLRDTLLPRLMSGELRIPDAERIAGEAL